MTPPNVMIIDGVTHVVHYRDSQHVITQNYSTPVASSQDPLRQPGPGIVGQSMYHLFRVVTGPGETLGEKVGEFSSLDAATARARQEQS